MSCRFCPNSRNKVGDKFLCSKINDVDENLLELAKKFEATDTINSATEENRWIYTQQSSGCTYYFCSRKDCVNSSHEPNTTDNKVMVITVTPSLAAQ